VVALCRPVLAPRGRGGLSDCWTLSGKATCLITKNAKRRYLQSGEGAFGRAPLSWRGVCRVVSLFARQHVISLRVF
jgi:hypothetical protein